MTRFLLIAMMLCACKKTSNEPAAAGSGSASVPAAVGDAAPAPTTDAPVAMAAPDATPPATAANAGCKPDAFTFADPPFCLDLPASVDRAKLQVLHDDGPDEVNIYRFEGSDDSISIVLDRKATDLAKAAHDAEGIAHGGASSKKPFKVTDIPDGKAITRTLCEAEIGCGPAVYVVKKTAVGMFTCQSSSQTQDEAWADICKSIK